uniref:Uncharacterized protein n=1 Tax=Psilocybe cubensis TaxID=181762 RepID=A0A8H8CP19_PSICU
METLKRGMDSLRGVDRSKATQILPVAEEMGFKLILAKLNHTKSGTAERIYGGCDYYRRKRQRQRFYDFDFYGYEDKDEDDEDEDGDDDVTMGAVSGTTTRLTEVVSLDGVPLLSIGTVNLGDDFVIPKKSFENIAPDENNYDSSAETMEYYYRRTVLVFIKQDKVESVLYKAGGPSYGLRKLMESPSITPTIEDLRWVDILVNDQRPFSKQQTILLLKRAFKWKDLKILEKIVQHKPCALEVVGADFLHQIWDTFSFKNEST